jgi:predicted alpha/beta-hydrolase family hydrolase
VPTSDTTAKTRARATPTPVVKPRSRGIAGLVLAPGASAGRDQPALVAIDEAVSLSKVVVVRIDFPYRLAGRRAPDRPPVLLATVVDAAKTLASTAGVAPRRIALGGRSMGGRICSMAVADGLAAAGLVLVSYPLHPPGKPDRLRTEHFGALEVPCLFISGTRDAFGSRDELEHATTTIPGPVTHVWIEGGDHGLRGKDSQVAGIVREWVTAH